MEVKVFNLIRFNVVTYCFIIALSHFEVFFEDFAYFIIKFFRGFIAFRVYHISNIRNYIDTIVIHCKCALIKNKLISETYHKLHLHSPFKSVTYHSFFKRKRMILSEIPMSFRVNQQIFSGCSRMNEIGINPFEKTSNSLYINPKK